MALAEERDALQATQPGDPRIATLTKEIDKEATSYWQSKWEEFLDGLDLKKGASHLWSTVKNLSGQQKPPASQPVTFCDMPVWDDKRCAKLFHMQLTPHVTTTSKANHLIARKLHKLKKGEGAFIASEVAQAIRTTKPSKAIGPNNVAPMHLKEWSAEQHFEETGRVRLGQHQRSSPHHLQGSWSLSSKLRGPNLDNNFK